MSFAGQQDTYLNVVGTEAVLRAVVDCWSSLWTARAIGYRARNQVSHAGAALAVVVQHMVESQASGVLFTANPLTGLRSETVIEATLGLGEALVSGKVEPDHYVVEPTAGRIVSKTLGAKAVSIHGQAGGGTRVTETNRAELQALPDVDILALAGLGRRVADLYAFPQDIEWAWADAKLYLLQSRPITSLFPMPEGMPAEPLTVMLSFSAVQGIFDPITPLGRYALALMFATGAGLFGLRRTAETQAPLITSGERLWLNFTPVLRNSLGRRAIHFALGMVEPTGRQALEQIKDDPRLLPGKPGISPHARLHLARFFVPLAGNVILNLVFPRPRREAIVRHGDHLLDRMQSRSTAIDGDRRQKLAQRADLLPQMADQHLLGALLHFMSGVAAGIASWNLLNLLAAGASTAVGSPAEPGVRDLVLQVTRGMPHNPTTEMDLVLWDMTKAIRRDPASLLAFERNSASQLSAGYLKGELPKGLQAIVDPFLMKYGGRGLGEIDLGRARWAEEPTHVFEMLASFLRIDRDDLAPDVVFARGAGTATTSIDQLAALVRAIRRGWLKAPLVRFFAGRARQLMGMRESPKFFAVRLMWLVHRELLKSGEEYAQAGDLDHADDVFFLTLPELREMAADGRDYRATIAARRESYRREMLRRQIPRLLVSDGRAFYAGMAAPDPSATGMIGSPVSPGTAEGRVRVVLDPRQAQLQPGEILVCPGTDPSWTPLFLSAGGLVMETGGMMTHGAVVAREYGIPAIVGVDRATLRLHTGQLIRINGSSGEIALLEGEAQSI
jgi:phosphohistidine swiveling domain-containing protein